MAENKERPLLRSMRRAPARTIGKALELGFHRALRGQMPPTLQDFEDLLELEDTEEEAAAQRRKERLEEPAPPGVLLGPGALRYDRERLKRFEFEQRGR